MSIRRGGVSLDDITPTIEIPNPVPDGPAPVRVLLSLLISAVALTALVLGRRRAAE